MNIHFDHTKLMPHCAHPLSSFSCPSPFQFLVPIPFPVSAKWGEGRLVLKMISLVFSLTHFSAGSKQLNYMKFVRKVASINSIFRALVGVVLAYMYVF